jgi:hypothetical protein
LKAKYVVNLFLAFVKIFGCKNTSFDGLKGLVPVILRDIL